MPSETLRSFLHRRPRLDRQKRRLLAEQARLMLETAYVHLPQKRAMYAIDPVQRLKLLEFRLEQMSDAALPSSLAFHDEMTAIFTSLRDLHTNYLLPQPYADYVAYLPFLVEEYRDDHGLPHYIVSHVVKGAERLPFESGVEVVYWNGVPIQRAVELQAEQVAGANPDARHALGLSNLTIRPMIRVLPPDEEWATVTFKGADGKVHECRHEWLVVDTATTGGVDPVSSAGAFGDTLGFGFDIQTERIGETRKILFAPEAVAAEAAIRGGGSAPQGLDTRLPGIFRAQRRTTRAGGEVGYLRIFSFLVAYADSFVDELRRLLQALPPDGLILDVRGNGGGNIIASERSLQLFTNTHIQPIRWQFINSPVTLALAKRYIDLKDWCASITQSVELGTLHSLAFPITPEVSCNDIGRVYPGKVVLVVDANCYSATDVFAAGFQDHSIGPILGTSGNTGAGGANVWTHQDLEALGAELPDDNGRAGMFQSLPNGAGMRVAIRRAIRVGPNAGIPVEDLGVVPDVVKALTRADLLGAEPNADLLETAAALIR